MKPHRRIWLLSLCVCALLAVLAPAAHALPPRPTGLTVIVGFPPDDLELSLRFQDGDAFTTVQLNRQSIAWEAQYWWFCPEEPPLMDISLIASTGGQTFKCPLPASMFTVRDNVLLSLDVVRQKVIYGQTVGRAAALVLTRALFMLLVEGALFFTFGYRKRRSWIAFAIINLMTQGTFNNALMSLGVSYLFIDLLPLGALLLLLELIAFTVILNEHRRLRTVAYVVAANLLSLGLGSLLLSGLPMWRPD